MKLPFPKHRPRSRNGGFVTLFEAAAACRVRTQRDQVHSSSFPESPLREQRRAANGAVRIWESTSECDAAKGTHGWCALNVASSADRTFEELRHLRIH